MNRGPGGRTDSPPEPPTPRAKPNRLSRSHRQNRAAAGLGSPKSQNSVFSLPEFKTPTRIPRSRPAGGFNEESPHESDCQQDIIWDASSPSPSRLGRRGKKHLAGVVNISEIVNRIAPKHGRPEAAEPTLQQWIGDSASIPCTPDLQSPKPKKKSPRPNGVDDLLKLAKQFDFNMFCQDEDEPEDVPPRSPDLLSKDVLDFRDADHSNEPAVNDGTDVQLRLEQQVEDDLNFLFDGPTQHVSGNLSQLSLAQPSQVNADVKPSPGPTGPVSTTNTERTSANDEFEDDWENDDLLNYSLTLEMTQKPQKFTALQHSSTQKPAPPVKYAAPVNVPVSGGVGLRRSAASNMGKENIRQRASFKLESNPNVSVTRVQTWANPKRADAQLSRVSSTTGKVGCERTGKSKPQKFQFNQRNSFACSSSAASAPNTSATKPEKPELISSHDAAYDFQDEDLDSFFSLDLVWDDPADDDLLCEVCEHLENQIQSVDNMRFKQSLPGGQVSNQREALQPSSRVWDNRNLQPAAGPAGTDPWPFPQKQTSTAVSCALGRPAETSSTRSAPYVKDSFRQTPRTARVQSAAAAPPPTNRGQFTFKKPNILESTAANKAVAKCSAAEIELKKQQAMERRRQRLQAAQYLPAPT